ncbi:MAG: MerR family transcriptional regulator [bacterium]|nr:MerR family transcriptional regulator [bacterium]
MAELRIGEIAARSGIAASAIRFYESEGLLPNPVRQSGRRVYDESILQRLGLIDLAKRAGFSVAEIKKLMAGFARRTPPAERWRGLTEMKLKQLDQRIAEAEQMKRVLRVVRSCRCPSLEDCSKALRASQTAGAEAE